MAIMAKSLVAFVVVLAMVYCAHAQCPAVNSYISCRPAVTTGTAPTADCCAHIQTVLAGANGPQCLCDALTSNLAKSIGVNFELASKLPQECRLNYIHNYNCKGASFHSFSYTISCWLLLDWVSHCLFVKRSLAIPNNQYYWFCLRAGHIVPWLPSRLLIKTVLAGIGAAPCYMKWSQMGALLYSSMAKWLVIAHGSVCKKRRSLCSSVMR